MKTDFSLKNLLQSNDWMNARVIYDPLLRWGLESLTGNFTRLITEKQAFALIRLFKQLASSNIKTP